MIEAVREAVVYLAHTHDGARVAMHCLWHGTPKVRAGQELPLLGPFQSPWGLALLCTAKFENFVLSLYGKGSVKQINTVFVV